MQITYMGPSADLEVNGQIVGRRGTIDVPDALAAELIERGDFFAGTKPPTVKELRAEAVALGITVPPKAKAATIAALIAAGPSAPEETEIDTTGDDQ